MASATKGAPEMGSASKHESQQPWSISLIIRRLRPMSPPRRDSIEGIRPGFLTMYWEVGWCQRVALFMGWGRGQIAAYCHEVGWVAADGIEFDARVTHELMEIVMGSKTDSMASALESHAQSYERLHIAWTAVTIGVSAVVQSRLSGQVRKRITSTADDLDDDIQGGNVGLPWRGGGWRAGI